MTLFIAQRRILLLSSGMIFLSDEDVDVKRLLTRWLNAQPKELRAGLSGWMDDMFYRSGGVVEQRYTDIGTFCLLVRESSLFEVLRLACMVNPSFMVALWSKTYFKIYTRSGRLSILVNPKGVACSRQTL